MNNNKHRFYLTQILTDIYSERELAHCLAEKKLPTVIFLIVGGL